MILAAIVFFAFIVEATAGFGATVITVTLAAQLLPIPQVLATVAPVNMMLSAYLVLRHRRFVDGRLLLRRILPYMGVGMAVGLALFQLRGHGWLRRAFAAFVVLLAASELRRARSQSTETRLHPVVGGAGLVAAGVVHGLFACGGPLVVWVCGREIDDKRRFRSTLSALWLALSSILITSYALSGEITTETARGSLVLLAPLAAGIWVGEHLHDRLPQRQFRLCVDVLLLVAGIALLVR